MEEQYKGKPRRLRGTPANRFANNITFAVLGVGVLIGFALLKWNIGITVNQRILDATRNTEEYKRKQLLLELDMAILRNSNRSQVVDEVDEIDETVRNLSSDSMMEDINNANKCETAEFENRAWTDSDSSFSPDKKSYGKLQRSQLPNKSFDDSPFLNFRCTKLKKKKSQSKLTNLKQPAGTVSREKNVSVLKGDKELNKSEENREVASSVANSSSLESPQKVKSKCEENCVRTCPVCWKKFENEINPMAHMKTCASKHNLTLRQLLDALDLQAKQIEERRTLGLPCVPNSVSSKKNVSRKSSRASHGGDPDLQLGLALSASMRESEEQDMLVEQEMMMEAGLGEEVAGKQATLLERFGFTSTRPVLPSIHPRTQPGKPKLKGTPLLLMRSQEDRERLITEKVAIILTNDEEQNKFLLSPNHSNLSCSHLKSELLSSLQNKDGGLWKRASASPQSNNSTTYYVEPLSHVITPSKSEIASKLKHLSQVPCRLKTPERHSVEDAKCFDLKEDTEEKGNDIICEENAQQNVMDMAKNENGDDVDVTLTAVHTQTIKGSCEFVHKLAANWKQLLNCKNKSDLSIHVKDRLEIPVHELVFLVRCPSILHDVVQEISCTGRCIKYITWNISFKCALAFLEFIYCGSTHKIDEMKNCVCVHEIIFLCRKYEVKELHTYLKPFEIKTGGFCICKDSSNKRESVGLIASTPEETGNGFHRAVASNACSSSESPNKNSAEHNLRMLECNENNDEIVYISSSQSNDSHTHDKLCSSPDPFSDSCDHVNGSAVLCKRRKSSPNTQQIMDCLLEVLDDENSQSNYNTNNSDEGEIKDCISLNISENCCSVTEKRKNYDFCNKSDLKRICTDDRKTVRKSLQTLFSGEGNDITHTGRDNKDICTLDALHSQSGNYSDSGKFIKTRGITNKNKSFVDDDTDKIQFTEGEETENERDIYTQDCSKEKLTPERKHMPVSCREGTDHDIYRSLRVLQTPGREHISKISSREETEQDVYTSPTKMQTTERVHCAVACKEEEHDICSFSTDKQMLEKDHNSVTSREGSEHIYSKTIPTAGENTPYISIEKTPCAEDAEGEMCADTLGDFCADYEYQNFQASYFPNAETFPLENHCKEKDAEDSSLEEKKLCTTKCMSEIGKSLFSSPVTVKSFSSEDTPVLSEKVFSERKRTWSRVKSSSDISVNGDSSSSSPIMVKCFSQNSIHLKTLQESVTERSNGFIPLEKDESDKKERTPLGMVLGTPLTQIPSTPNTTMNSLKHLLDDSFTDELQRNSLFSGNDLEALQCSTPMTTSRVSSKQMKDLLQEENCVTPMADYSEMDTPGLKKELQKYGLKPLKRKRAKQILRHIYEELHPLVPAQRETHKVSNKKSISDRSSMTSTEEGLVYDKSKAKSQTKHTPQKEETSTADTARETDLPSENDSFLSTQESSSSSRCEFEISEDGIEEDVHTQVDESDLPTVVHNYIVNNTVVHHQVLLFEPIWLDQLQDALKAENYKFKLNSLMEYLDEQCISFRIAQSNRNKRRRKKEKSSK